MQFVPLLSAPVLEGQNGNVRKWLMIMSSVEKKLILWQNNYFVIRGEKNLF